MLHSLRLFLCAATFSLAACSVPPNEVERNRTDLRTVDDRLIEIMAPDAAELIKAHPWAVVQRLDDEHILFMRDVGSGGYVCEYSLYRREEKGDWGLVGKGSFSTISLLKPAVIENGNLCFIDSEGQTIHRMKIAPAP